METIKLNEEFKMENFAKCAYLSENFGGVFSEDAFKNSEGLHVNIKFDFEYTEKWGWDCEELAINFKTLSKKQALKVLELRPDLKNILIKKDCKIE